jgi:hypothetical protein
VPFRFLQLKGTVLGEEEEYYRQIEEALLIIATPGIWFYLMFFAG